MTYTFDENIVSNLHKDAFGFRPSRSWYWDWNGYSDDEKQKEWDFLLQALKRGMEDEARREDDAIFDFDCEVRPDFFHRVWDVRAQQEVAPGDVAVFARGTDSDTPTKWTFDDSREF